MLRSALRDTSNIDKTDGLRERVSRVCVSIRKDIKVSVLKDISQVFGSYLQQLWLKFSFCEEDVNSKVTSFDAGLSSTLEAHALVKSITIRSRSCPYHKVTPEIKDVMHGYQGSTPSLIPTDT